MELLATFPAVTIGGATLPEEAEPPAHTVPASAASGRPAPRHPVRPARRLPPWSVTILSVVAAAVWIAVLAVERVRSTPPAAKAYTVATEEPPGGTVSR